MDKPLDQMALMAKNRYFSGIWGDHEFTDWRDENVAAKQTCFIGDWSWLLTRRYRGADVVRLFADLSVNNYTNFEVGRDKHVVFCNEDGKIIHDGVLARESETSIIQFGRGCEYVDFAIAQGDYEVRSQRLDWFKYQVSGPKALSVLESASSAADLADTPFMHWATIEIEGCEVWAMRTGMAGEQGFELQGDYGHATAVYDAILAAGEQYGIRRLGGRAAMINHLEACFPTVGTDYLPAIFGPDMAGYQAHLEASSPGILDYQFIRGGSMKEEPIDDYYRGPVELGWGRSVKFDHEFVGRSALEREANSAARKIVTLEWDSDAVVEVYRSLFEAAEPYPFMDMPRELTEVMYADKVLSGGACVGISSSRGYSFWFRKMLSLAVVESETPVGDTVDVLYGEPGTRQVRIPATVAPAPYKRDRRRDGVPSAPT